MYNIGMCKSRYLHMYVEHTRTTLFYIAATTLVKLLYLKAHL